jgi:hypothetical protein
MRHHVRGGAAALLAVVLFAVTLHAATAQSTVPGTWQIRATERPGVVQLTLRSRAGAPDSEAWMFSQPVGVERLGISPAQVRSANHALAFSIQRDAGTFRCEGSLGRGAGSGDATFIPNAGYLAALRQRGYAVRTARDEVMPALLNVTLAYADGLAAAGYTPMTVAQLADLKTAGVTPEYARAIRAEIHNAGPSDAITLRELAVSPAYVGALRSAGAPIASAQDVMSLKEAGVDAAFVKRLSARGGGPLTIDRILMMKLAG